MTHKEIQKQMTEAMKARDEVRLSVLRGLLSAFTNELVAKKKKPQDELSDDEVMDVISRNAKQRKDSIEQFKKGGREDLAEKEEAELKILEEFLPEQMSDEKILEIAKAKKEELGIDDKSKMGILIGSVMKEVKGRADGNKVRDIISSVL